MKKSTKAVLLSALVFPGVGHFFLKRYLSGILLAGASFAAVYYLTSKILEKVLRIAEEIQSGSVQLNVQAISNLASSQTTGAEAQILNVITILFIVCWLIGVVDSFRVGRVQDKNP